MARRRSDDTAEKPPDTVSCNYCYKRATLEHEIKDTVQGVLRRFYMCQTCARVTEVTVR